MMNDGEVLKDGGANPEAGDRFKIVVRLNCDCYLYIMSIDGSGWAEPVFPKKDGKTPNPVSKDQEYAFPEGSRAGSPWIKSRASNRSLSWGPPIVGATSRRVLLKSGPKNGRKPRSLHMWKKHR